MSEPRPTGPSRSFARAVEAADPLRETRKKLEEAERLRRLGQLDRARAICEPLVARHGDYFGALHTLGLIYADMNQYPMALGFLVRAAMLNPRSWTTLTALSGVYLRLGAREMAAHTLEQARSIKPQDAGVLMTLGEIYSDDREYELARDAYQGARALESSLDGAAFGLAKCWTHLGQYAEAAEILEGLIKRGNRSLDVLFELNLLPHSVVRIDVLKQLDKAVRDQDQSELDFQNSSDFVRAAFLDKAGRHAEAWRHLVQANQTMAQALRNELADRTEMQVESLAALRKSTIKSPPHGGNREKTVSLFVLGPSRSGKTSMESILATLDGVKRGYENPIVENAVRRAFQSSGFLSTAYFEALPPQFYPLCNEIYLEELGRRAGSAKVFTNTHPAHIANAGRIASVFPNVRFVLMKRNLQDNALRVYMRKYRQGNAHAYDLKSIHEHLVWYHEMIDLLAEKFPDRTRVIHYEDMVVDPTAALRTAAELCGLPTPTAPAPAVGDDRGCAEPYAELMSAALNG